MKVSGGLLVLPRLEPSDTRSIPCNNLDTDEIDDHRIQSDYKCTNGLQNLEGKNSVLGIASSW